LNDVAPDKPSSAQRVEPNMLDIIIVPPTSENVVSTDLEDTEAMRS
jgi:hypothetical protein